MIPALNQEIVNKLEELVPTTNGSLELHFDDEGLIQEITIRQKRRRREGESLKIFHVQNGKAIANYDNDGIIQQITYETKWRRQRFAK